MRSRLLVLTLAGALLVGVNAGAQTVGTTTGAISGTVTDITGAILPGVTVTVTSEAMMVPRKVVTDDDGRYRVPLLPPGTYSVVFTRERFLTVRVDGVPVGTGVSANVPAELGPAAVQNVEVIGESRLLDRHTTAVAWNFTAEQLASIPNSRTVVAILSATPAVQMARSEVGGATGDVTGSYTAYGGPFPTVRPTVEGINVTGMFPAGFMLDYGAFKEATVYTAAHGAEWSGPGVHTQIISKSGGNRYRGTFYADYEHRNWQAFNIDQDQVGRGAAGGRIAPRDANRVWGYSDTSADVGGFVVRDRLWWYAAARNQNVSTRHVNFPIVPLRTQLTNLSGKATARFSGNNTLIAYGQVGRNYQPIRLDPFGAGNLTAATAFNQDEADTVEQRAWGWVWKAEWSSVIGNALFVEARAGQFGADRPERPKSNTPRYEDIATGDVSGGNRDWQMRTRRPQVDGSATYFKDGWLGSHQVKVGAEITRWVSSQIWKRSYPGDVLHVLRGGAPYQVYLFQPSESSSGLWTAAAYLTDAWRVHNRVTLNLGLRFERLRVFLPQQTLPAGRLFPTTQSFPADSNLIAWNTTVPRVGAIIDLSGDGRTIGKLAYGQYAISPNTAIGATANPNPALWWRQYDWSDANDNLVWDPDEENRDRLRGSRGGGEGVDPRLELPSLKEIGGWLERELPGRVRLKTGVVWRGEQDHYMRQNTHTPPERFTQPVVIRDPGIDGDEGTEDDNGPQIQAYQLGPEFLPLRQDFQVQNVPGADTRFWTWDFGADRRSSGRWLLFSAGASVTWHADHAATFFGQPVRQNQYAINPNDSINAGEGGRYQFTTWTVKAHGTYEAPWRLRITPHLRHQSGQPFGRTFNAPLNYAQGMVRILAEPIGTRRMNNITLVDVRIERTFRPAGWRIGGFLDLYNLFNANPEQNTSWLSGTFLRPLDIVPPRIARIGARIDW